MLRIYVLLNDIMVERQSLELGASHSLTASQLTAHSSQLADASQRQMVCCCSDVLRAIVAIWTSLGMYAGGAGSAMP